MENIMTCEEMKNKFEKEEWDDVHFEEITQEEALKNGMLYMINEIAKGKQFFRMIGSGNIFNTNGKVVYYNLKCKEIL